MGSPDPEVEFYETDGGTDLAFMGTMGFAGVFAWVPSEPGGPRSWKYFPAGSKAWDMFHQQVYRNHRADAVEPAVALARTGPLPPLPEVTGQTWESNFTEVKDPAVLEAPRLLARVREAPAQSLPFWIVLCEDTYESGLGDGRFLDFQEAFLSEADAHAYIAAQKHRREGWGSSGGEPYYWYAFHVRPMTLGLAEDGRLALPDFHLDPFEHASVEEILRSLAGKA